MNLQNQIEESQNFSSKIPDDWESIDELRVVNPEYEFIRENLEFSKQCSSTDFKVIKNSYYSNLDNNEESFDHAGSSKLGNTFNPSDGRPFRLLRRPESLSKLKESVTDDLQKMTKSLTLEEREAAYLEARKRIFGSHTDISENVCETTQETLPLIDDNLINQPNLFSADTTLWMGDLKADWDAKFIRDAFQQMSYEVRNVKMMADRFGSKSSYCFIEFHDAESARSTMLNLSGKLIPNDLEGGKFTLSFANAPNQSLEFNLFVSNLDSTVDDLLLFRTFGERYLTCRGAKIYHNTDGSSREIGLVRFTSEADQQKALIEMNKFRINNKEILLKIAQSKDRHHGKVYTSRSSYNERERIRGGSRFNSNTPYIQSNVLPSIIGASIYPNTSQPTSSSYISSGYNISQSGIPVQIPYGAPPPFLMIQYPSLIPPNTNIQHINGSMEGGRWN